MPEKKGTFLESCIKRFGAKYITLVDTFVRGSCVLIIVPTGIYYFYLVSGISDELLPSFLYALLSCLFLISIPHTMFFTNKISKQVRAFLNQIKHNEYCRTSRQELWDEAINIPTKIAVNLLTVYTDAFVPVSIYLYIFKHADLAVILHFAVACFICTSLIAKTMYFFDWEVAVRPILSLILTTDLLPEEEVNVKQYTYIKMGISRKLKLGVISIVLVSLILSGTLGYSKLKEGVTAVGQNLPAGMVFSNFAFQMAMIALATVTVVLILIVFLSRSVSIPLTVLSHGMEMVAEGNLEHQVEIISNDELGIVAQGFNNMTAQLSESYRKITEQNVKLKEMDKLKSQFLANTSHELRTPLNGIIGLADAMLAGSDGEVNGKQQAHLTMIKNCGENLRGLVNSLLDLTKTISGQAAFKMRFFSLNSLLDIILPVMQGATGKKKINLKTDIDKNIKDIYGDMEKLWQVFNNLIGNAIKFTESGDVIVRTRKIVIGDLSACPQAESSEGNGNPKGSGAGTDRNTNPPAEWTSHEAVQISIEDSGIGIAPEHHQRIFEEFWQVDGGVDRKYEGTGLGLAICKKIIEGHHGKIWVESELGKGSKFHLILPLAPCKNYGSGNGMREEPAAIIKTVTPLPVKTTPESARDIVYETGIDPKYKITEKGHKERILVIDDNPVNREVVKTHLEFYNYTTETAEDGETGLKKAMEDRFDLIILDLMMPKMSGYEFCKRIKKVKQYEYIPIIMLTAKGTTEDIVYGFNLGADDYLPKPFNKEELIVRINALIRYEQMKLRMDKTIAELEAAKGELLEIHEQLEIKIRERTLSLEKANGELQTERDRVGSYLEIIGVILLVISIDGNVFLINKKGCEILGYGERDIIGKSWFDNFLPERIRTQMKAVFSEFVSGKSDFSGYFENPVLTRTGGERIILWNNKIIRNKNGEIIALLSSGEDVTRHKLVEEELRKMHRELELRVEKRTAEITRTNIKLQKEVNERQRIEQGLRESEEKYRSLVENINIGVYRNTGGPKGQFLQANPAIAKMFGYGTVEEFMNMHVSDLYQNPEDRQLFINDLLKAGFVKDKELKLRRKDGTPIWAACSAKIKYDANGGIEWIDGVIEDITERKQAEKELLAAKEAAETSSLAKDHFIANMSRKIITPLNGIINLIETALNTNFQSEQRRNLEMARKSADELMAVINISINTSDTL